MDKDSNDVQVSTVTANDRIITLAPFVLTCPPHATTHCVDRADCLVVSDWESVVATKTRIRVTMTTMIYRSVGSTKSLARFLKQTMSGSRRIIIMIDPMSSKTYG
jgi:hypothetical protein